MKKWHALTVVLTLLVTGCSIVGMNRDTLQEKVGFDLKRLDKDGLYGPADGKRALSYEFCIPGTIENAREVMQIDPSIIIYKDSPGRLQCGKDQYLAMGDTFQVDYRATLKKLTELDYVTRIVEVFFE